MIERIAQALLLRVYDAVTALVCMGPDKRIQNVLLFDTYCGMPESIEYPEAESVHLIFNHPEGRLFLVPEEIGSCRRICAGAGNDRVHIYLFGEDIGLIEVDRNTILDYNGENTAERRLSIGNPIDQKNTCHTRSGSIFSDTDADSGLSVC